MPAAVRAVLCRTAVRGPAAIRIMSRTGGQLGGPTANTTAAGWDALLRSSHQPAAAVVATAGAWHAGTCAHVSSSSLPTRSRHRSCPHMHARTHSMQARRRRCTCRSPLPRPTFWLTPARGAMATQAGWMSSMHLSWATGSGVDSTTLTSPVSSAAHALRYRASAVCETACGRSCDAPARACAAQAGSGLYTRSQLMAATQLLADNVFGNPHRCGRRSKAGPIR